MHRGGKPVWFLPPPVAAPHGMSRGAAAVWQAEIRREEALSHARERHESYLWVEYSVSYDGTCLGTQRVHGIGVTRESPLREWIATDMWVNCLADTVRAASGLRGRLQGMIYVLEDKLTHLADPMPGAAPSAKADYTDKQEEAKG